MTAIENRYEFVFLFDVQDGNPNGDPDAGNLPRIDPENGEGLVTDVCLKRKVRNFVIAARNNQPPHEIFVMEKAVLNQQIERAHQAIGGDATGKDKRKDGDSVEEARKWMCANFYDVRTFGAVMSTGLNAGQVLGPVQMTFARSSDRIVPAEHSITRMAVATEKEAEAQKGDNRTMGRKATIPYGLYRTSGFVNVPPARKTGFSADDLTLFWEALKGMFDLDRSAARGLMAPRRLVVFKHESALGNAPAHTLLERVRVKRITDQPPRNFADYEVTVDESNMPKGVSVEHQI
jgi:CRISPR-associated protein Csd2